MFSKSFLALGLLVFIELLTSSQAAPQDLDKSYDLTCGGDPNAAFHDCTFDPSCAPTCERPGWEGCVYICGPPGCQCKLGYVMVNGKCEHPTKCQVPGCGGDLNAEFSDCTPRDRPTCDDPNPKRDEVCYPPGCVCKSGHVILDGKCVLQTECPAVTCGGDSNAEFSNCTSRCPPTCADPNPKCTDGCFPPGCQCKQGYVRFIGKCEPRSIATTMAVHTKKKYNVPNSE